MTDYGYGIRGNKTTFWLKPLSGTYQPASLLGTENGSLTENGATVGLNEEK